VTCSAPRYTVLVTAAAVVGLLAGCTTSGQPEAVRNTVPSAAPTTRTTPTTTATTTAPPSTPTAVSIPTTSAPATSAPPSSTAPATTSAPNPTAKTTCKALSVRVLIGGAGFGEQIAAVQYTNEGPSTCVLVGYPTVTLLLHGQQIGRPSQPASAVKSKRTLRPGEVAESLLHDYTQTCQAPLSDSVRVQVPGTRQTVIRPEAQLRACVLRVDRLTAPE
jgi:Protein of unknown function (DUF4232)